MASRTFSSEGRGGLGFALRDRQARFLSQGTISSDISNGLRFVASDINKTPRSSDFIQQFLITVIYQGGSSLRDNIRVNRYPCSMARVQIPGVESERCGHIWTPRLQGEETPRVCPKCKSPYWDKPRRRRRSHGEKGPRHG